MKQETYNGWSNYATWRINLELFDGMEFDHYPSDDELKELAEDIVLEGCSKDSLAQSYALAFMSDVNWSEIASHVYYIEEKEGV